MDVITIQHTQSVHHTNGMVGSWTDWDLTDLGKEQGSKGTQSGVGSREVSQVAQGEHRVY